MCPTSIHTSPHILAFILVFLSASLREGERGGGREGGREGGRVRVSIRQHSSAFVQQDTFIVRSLQKTSPHILAFILPYMCPTSIINVSYQTISSNKSPHILAFVLLYMCPTSIHTTIYVSHQYSYIYVFSICGDFLVSVRMRTHIQQYEHILDTYRTYTSICSICVLYIQNIYYIYQTHIEHILVYQWDTYRRRHIYQTHILVFILVFILL